MLSVTSFHAEGNTLSFTQPEDLTAITVKAQNHSACRLPRAAWEPRPASTALLLGRALAVNVQSWSAGCSVPWLWPEAPRWRQDAHPELPGCGGEEGRLKTHRLT